LIVDPTRAITESVHPVLAPTGATTVASDSLQELTRVFEATGQPDLLVVEASGHALDLDVAAQIRRSGYRGRILALADDPR